MDETMNETMAESENGSKENWIEVNVLEIEQPIGRFYYGAMSHADLIKISYADRRRIDKEKRDVETYLGIERPLRRNRIGELRDYVNTVDAAFPSPIILAIDEEHTDIDPKTGLMLIRNRENVAQILDGQHRIAGLEGFEGEKFDVLVTIFLEMDIEYQAMIFATINLEQTRVNKSLAYDLYAYATKRSPQRTCHNIVRLLNSRQDSPFFNKIKILGIAGDKTETISQALFIDSMLPLISPTPLRDRDALRKDRGLQLAMPGEVHNLIFRNLFIQERDGEIARVLWNYFKTVEKKWGKYWTDIIPRHVLNRTTGFRGLMQFLPFAFVAAGGLNGNPTDADFEEIFSRIDIPGEEITPENFPPGTTGATRFRDRLKAQAGLE